MSTKRRYCTVPNIYIKLKKNPFKANAIDENGEEIHPSKDSNVLFYFNFRDWYTARYNDVCEWHDEQYKLFHENKPYTFHELLWRFESDVGFVKAIIRKYRDSKIHAKIGHALFAIAHLPFPFIPNNLVYVFEILYNKIKKAE